MTNINRLRKYLLHQQQRPHEGSTGFAAGRSSFLLDHSLSWSTPQTPHHALARLVEGNARFAEKASVAIHQIPEYPKATARHPSPFAVFLSCSDLPTSIEIVFDQRIGDLFVAQIAGNIATDQIIECLEHGIEKLGAKVLFILGHSNCATIDLTMNGRTFPGHIHELQEHIRKAIKTSHGNLRTAVLNNVRNQAEWIAENSRVVAKRLQREELILMGGVYDLETRIVEFVETDV